MKTDVGKTVHAKDLKCCKCKKAQAVAFWPCIDPDIQSHPYCKKCLDEVNIELLIAICEQDEEERKRREKEKKGGLGIV